MAVLGAANLTDRQFDALRLLAQSLTGIRIQTSRRPPLAARIAQFVGGSDEQMIGAFIQAIRRPGRQQDFFVSLITINETRFFRERPHLRHVIHEFLPAYIKAFPRRTPLRVLSAACSSGEEAYTLAMVFKEFSDRSRPVDFEVTGLDIDKEILRNAQRAIYPIDSASNIPRDLFRKYCSVGTGQASGYFRIDKFIRQKVKFITGSLLSIPSFAQPFDLIFCKNVFIYFDDQVIAEAIAALSTQLNEGGSLYVGMSEAFQRLSLPVRGIAGSIFIKDPTSGPAANQAIPSGSNARLTHFRWSRGTHFTSDRCSVKCIGIGSSTGGTDAIRKILPLLPPGLPPIVIAQHIPQDFSKAFADRLNHECAFPVVEAVHGMKLEAGKAYVAPGGRHTEVFQKGRGFFLKVSDTRGELVFAPSVDLLFNSMAKAFKKDSLALVLTGMGKDGAEGIRSLGSAGAMTVAQDEFSSVVYGMPKEALGTGALRAVVPLEEIAEFLMQYLGRGRISEDLQKAG